jgi:hypothetical protein
MLLTMLIRPLTYGRRQVMPRTYERYHPNGARVVTEAYVSDLCSQTVVNARIAQRKFELFDRGVSFVLAALFLLIIPFFIGLLRTMFL